MHAIKELLKQKPYMFYNCYNYAHDKTGQTNKLPYDESLREKFLKIAKPVVIFKVDDFSQKHTQCLPILKRVWHIFLLSMIYGLII